MEKLGLLGGSFDPIHNGHLAMAEQALSELDLDRVLFLPAKQSPLRANQHLSSFADRCEMVSLAIADQPGFSLCDVEGSLPSPSYAIQTLQELHKTSPNTKFYWILGQDQADKLSQWHQIDDLLKLVQFAYFSRADYLSQETPTAYPILALSGKIPAVSSTIIREEISSGKKEHPLLPDKVCNYISKNSLYQ